MPYEDKGRLSSTASPYKLVDHLPRRTALQSRPAEARGSASPLAVQPSFFAGLSNVAVVLPAMARDLALDFSQAGLPAGALFAAYTLAVPLIVRWPIARLPRPVMRLARCLDRRRIGCRDLRSGFRLAIAGARTGRFRDDPRPICPA